MRKVILIAAMVLASASAQAGESRSLSTGLTANDPPAATNSAPRTNNALRAENTPSTEAPLPPDAPRYSAPAETPPPVEPTRNTSDTPRYTARPAAVDATPSTTHRPPGEASYHPSRAHYARAERPHYRPHLTAGRIIAALHRYGIYW
jgi:hypothetical protein